MSDASRISGSHNGTASPAPYPPNGMASLPNPYAARNLNEPGPAGPSRHSPVYDYPVHDAFMPTAGPPSYNHLPPTVPSPSSSAAVSSSHGKRKESIGPLDDGDSPAGEEEKKKRAKTARACDPCRRKKIRCDILPDTDPPLCKYCQQHNKDCTYFLPIAETRFKRKKQESQGASDDSPGPSQPQYIEPAQRHVPHTIRPPPLQPQALARAQMPRVNTGMPARNPQNVLPSPLSAESRVLGPTSMSYLMHSMSTFPVDAMREYDSKWMVAVGQDDDGLIQLRQPDQPTAVYAGRYVNGVERLPPELVQQLVNQYFDLHASIFPVITKANFLQAGGCPPILLEIICAMTASSSHYPSNILSLLKKNIWLLTREEDLMGRSTLQQVQAMLLFGFTFELERGLNGTRNWNMLGVAIRMAYDLGLHREYASAAQPDLTVNTSELRRRTWAGLVIADRWLSAIYGLPMSIDLADCDRLFPSPFDLQPGQKEADMDPSDQPFLAFNKLLELSILLGRVLKLAYTPTGILGLTDETAKQMEDDIYGWYLTLPDHLRHDNEAPAPAAGYLNLLMVPVLFLFARPFMRISFTVEALTYSFGMENWHDMVQRSTDAISWAEQNSFCIESWCPGLYGLFICALIQYHMHVRSGEEQYLVNVQRAADVLRMTQNEECMARGRFREIVTLLHQVGLSLKNFDRQAGNRGMNPTKGVRMRNREPNTRWDETTRSFINMDNGDHAEPLTSYTAATGPSPSASTPTSDVRSTSGAEGSRSVPAPVEPLAMPRQVDVIPPSWRATMPNVNPNLNIAAHTGDPHVLEPSLDFFGANDGTIPPYDASFFPETLLDLGSWSTFFDGAQGGHGNGLP